MRTRIYIASALALGTHALLFALVSTFSTAPPTRQQDQEPASAIMLVDIDTIGEEAILNSQPQPTPLKVDQEVPRDKPKATPSSLPKISVRPDFAERKRHSPSPQTNSTNVDGEPQPEAKQPSTASNGGLSMRGPSVGPIDVRGSGQLAAAVASVEIPGRQSRDDLLSGANVPSVGETPTWSPSGNGTFRATKEPFHAKITNDGRIHFRDKRNVQIEGIKIDPKTLMPVLKGRFDLTDAVMKSFGETLYPYRKLKLMDESREARGQMANKYQSELLKKALFGFRRRLTRIWKAKYTPAQRKELLFALWDECEEKGPSDIVTTARSIRATILQFIRKKLPPGHPNAYTAGEIRRYNAKRHSDQRFVPY